MSCSFDIKTYEDHIYSMMKWRKVHGDKSVSIDFEPFWKSSEIERKSFVNNIWFTILKDTSQRIEFFKKDHIELYKQGRLLLFFPDMSLSDTLAQTLTQNFLNQDNLAPAHTWLYYFSKPYAIENIHSHFLSWIPPEQIDPVSDSIYQSADNSISFLKDVEMYICYKEILQNNDLLV